MPAAPIHAMPHFVAFFVARVVVYASSQDFVETALGQPYFSTKRAFVPALYQMPGSSTHSDHIQTHTISPHKPGSAEKKGMDMGRIGAGKYGWPQKAHKPQKTGSFVSFELFVARLSLSQTPAFTFCCRQQAHQIGNPSYLGDPLF